MAARKPRQPVKDEAAELAELEAMAGYLNAEPEAAGPVVLEFGRYRVFQAPDGGWAVARAVNICGRCQGCGCGDQAEVIQIPAFVIQMAKAQGTGLLGKLKSRQFRRANG